MNTSFIYTLCLFIIHTPVFLNGRNRMTRYEPDFEYQPLELWPHASSKSTHRTVEVYKDHDDHKKLLNLFARTNNEVLKQSLADPVNFVPPFSLNVKDAEAFLSVMLRMLKTLFVKKPPADNTKQKSTGGSKQGIAWSYYDDAGK